MTLAIRRSSIARSVRINHRLLFHLPTDPHEMNNLAEDAAHAPEVARLTAMMETWRVSLGDKDPLSVANPEPMQPVYDNSSRTPDMWQPRWIRDKYFDGRDSSSGAKK
jgi:hypothetical protein